MYEQMNIFDLTMRTYWISNPIRLIELFAGIGSQAMALRDLGADFEHYRAVEFDKYAVASYNAIHGTDFKETDIREISGADLGICDTDKFCYIMTYSFPCQDLSVAGMQKGMTKGSGTRSGLLWEVERLLNECDELPQLLLMENVPQVHSEINMPDFQKWIDFLESRGYSNYWQDLNAKDYGVAQNRERCFMVSILGEWNYKFPRTVKLQRVLGDYLDKEVDERYYINSEKAQKLIQKCVENGTIRSDCDYEIEGNFNQRGVHGQKSVCRTILGGGSHCGNEPKVCIDLSIDNPAQKDVSNCITARENRGISKRQAVGTAVVEPVNAMPDGTCRTIKSQYFKNSIQNFENKGSYGATGVVCIGNIYGFDGGNYAGNVYEKEGVSPAIRTYQGGGQQPMIVAMRGRNPDNQSDRTAGCQTEQRLEPNSQGICNTLTSVQKDNMVLENVIDLYNQKLREDECCGTITANGNISSTKCGTFGVVEKAAQYRIRKLTPKECWRLMGFSDEDFNKAEKVNSNTQLYKQAGNSIVKNVLIAIFMQMLEG